jgi:hypothetical protein
VLELLLVTYSLSGDRNPPATPLYSGDEAQIREALADVILAHASAAAAAVAAAGQDQQQVQQVLGTLHQELQCLPQTQQLVLEVRGKHGLHRPGAGFPVAWQAINDGAMICSIG